MELPDDSQKLTWWAKELIDECLHSRETRRTASALWRKLFYTGSFSGVPSRYNRCFTHVDKLSSYVFSSADVRFTVEFEGDSLPAWQAKGAATSKWLNRRFKSSASGVAFSQANQIALVEGCALAKLTFGPGGNFQPWPIRPVFFGVLREDLPSLELQEAFVHSFYITKDGFRRMIWNHPDRLDLMARVSTMAAPTASADIAGDSYFYEIATGGMQPIGYVGAPAAAAYGQVSLTAPMTPMVSPEVVQDLIRLDELWVWDDRREDWTTIRYIEPGMLLEGKYQRRNLSDIPKMHPFVKVCSNEVPGYFWGRSELAPLIEPQRQISMLMDDINAIWRLRAKPPRAFSGFNSVTDEKARALLAPGGKITEQAVGAKVDNLAPELPPETLDLLEKYEDIFDDVGGFTNILSGEGEPGVRAGVHAGTLLRTSTPRLRERALLTESQAGKFGQLHLKMGQAKEAKVLIPDGELAESFLLAQLPEDANATVDSHTSSPAFVDDERQLAIMLAKAEAIDGQTLIEMTHPPREDLLIERYKARQKAQAEWAQQHPVEAAEMAKKK